MLVGKLVLSVKNLQTSLSPLILYDLYVYPEMDIRLGEGKGLQTSRSSL